MTHIENSLPCVGQKIRPTHIFACAFQSQTLWPNLIFGIHKQQYTIHWYCDQWTYETARTTHLRLPVSADPQFQFSNDHRNTITTKNIEIVKHCQEYFGFALPSLLFTKRVSKFESSFKCFLFVLYLCCSDCIRIVYSSTMFLWWIKDFQ